MGIEHYLICEEKRTAFNLGKGFGGFDVTETDAETFRARMREEWLGEDERYVADRVRYDLENQQRALAYAKTRAERARIEAQLLTTLESERAYADALAEVVFRFCVEHAWKVRMVHDDFFFDDAKLDSQAWIDRDDPAEEDHFPHVYAGWGAQSAQDRQASLRFRAKHDARPLYRLLGERYTGPQYVRGLGYDVKGS